MPVPDHEVPEEVRLAAMRTIPAQATSQPRTISTAPMLWQVGYQAGWLAWWDYDVDLCRQLERDLEVGQGFSWYFPAYSTDMYIMNPVERTQTNLRTGEARPIRRIWSPHLCDDLMSVQEGKAVWQAQYPKPGWVAWWDYTNGLSKYLDACRAENMCAAWSWAWNSNPSLTDPYRLDPIECYQVNERTREMRSIRRILVVP